MPDAVLIRTVREQVADRLREDIFCNRLAAGERLSEHSLSKRFGVGRGPIREALLQLTHEGLLVAKPNCGVTVAPAPSDALQQVILPIRRTLETYALRSVFDGLTASDFRVWDEVLLHLGHACRTGDLPGILNHDMAFHRAIMVRAGDPDLLGVWQSLVGRVRSYFWTAIKQFDDLREVHADHERLLATFRAGDKDAAVAALNEHIW